MELPFELETDLECTIVADPIWLEGAVWGKPRRGHMEGPVMNHIAEVFANIEKLYTTPEDRRALRLIALTHDTLKYRVNEHLPAIGTNHHAHLARVFAEHYIQELAILDIIELHDEAYNSWRLGAYKGKWKHAEERLARLIEKLGSALPLYVRFFYADSQTESKDQAPVDWFAAYLKRHSL